jgi:hypothetical protein
MDFILFHQHGRPVLVHVDSVKLVYPATKGKGAFIVTDQEGHDIEVDESIQSIIDRLTEMQIEVDMFAND